MAVTASYNSSLTVVETLTENMPAATDANVQHGGFNKTKTLNAGSTPPATKTAFFELALTAGAGSIDLTVLEGANGAVVDGSGLRVQAIKVRNKVGNGNVMTFKIGAANGYDGFGAAFSVTLAPGAEMLLETLDGGGDIGSTNRILDVVGTGSQVAQVGVVLG